MIRQKANSIRTFINDALQIKGIVLPPTKRIKLNNYNNNNNSSTDESVILNDKGIANMINGLDNEAERCFSQALFCLENSTILKPCNDPITHSPHKIIATMEQSNNTSTVSQTSIPVSETEIISANLSYIRQRHEYDEGISIYTEALSLYNIKTIFVRSATLLFNSGK